ncbi:hypothetical protein [Dactylosporangium sp. CA-233914]
MALAPTTVIWANAAKFMVEGAVDITGAVICLIGVAVIMYAPRH